MAFFVYSCILLGGFVIFYLGSDMSRDLSISQVVTLFILNFTSIFLFLQTNLLSNIILKISYKFKHILSLLLTKFIFFKFCLNYFTLEILNYYFSKNYNFLTKLYWTIFFGLLLFKFVIISFYFSIFIYEFIIVTIFYIFI